MDIVSYILGEGSTETQINDVLDDLGVVRGAPCEVENKEEHDDRTEVTLGWTGRSGTHQTTMLTLYNGKSAYALAVERGYTGTLDEWIASLIGADGLSAYELAVEEGYTGTLAEWLETLKGEDGVSPEITEAEKTSTTYKLRIKTADDEFVTPNLKGSGGGGSVDVDDALSATSENPVQNKVITAALAGKADADDIPDISGLARQSELDALAETVSEKADASALETLAGTVSSKADASALDDKVDKETGKGLSANDYTDGDKNKLEGIAEEATKDTPDGETLKKSAAGVWSVNIYPNAGAHNAIYRGKYLGNHVTAEQYAAIAAGTFDDLFIGDYWTINGVNWRIADFDYYLKDNSIAKHHAVIVPDDFLYTAKMNEEQTTGIAYAGSAMYGSDYLHTGGGLAQAVTIIKNAFAQSHILKHKTILYNAISNNIYTSYIEPDSEIELMTERMIIGCPSISNTNNCIDYSQLSLFRHNSELISSKINAYWLRDNVSDHYFAIIRETSIVDAAGDEYNLGVRPYFCIYGGENT